VDIAEIKGREKTLLELAGGLGHQALKLEFPKGLKAADGTLLFEIEKELRRQHPGGTPAVGRDSGGKRMERGWGKTYWSDQTDSQKKAAKGSVQQERGVSRRELDFTPERLGLRARFGRKGTHVV